MVEFDFEFELLNVFIIILCNMIAAGVFYYFEKKNKSKNMSIRRRVAIGIIFGIISVMGTEFGATVDGFTLNVRDAAPITAGLMFDGLSGVIAGCIGGIWRWIAALFGAGMYTRVACTVATILAGIIAALVRKYMLDYRKPNWVYCTFITATLEIVHMLMVFLTNMDDVQKAFSVVQKATFPMLVANVITVLCAYLVITIMSKQFFRLRKSVRIEQSFSRWLFLCVCLAFLGSNIFTYILDDNLARENAISVIKTDIEDVVNDVGFISDSTMLSLVEKISGEVDKAISDDKLSDDVLIGLAKDHGVPEINYIDKRGIIVYSTISDYVGFDMYSSEQSLEFMNIFNGKNSVVQAARPNGFKGIVTKYAALKLKHDGFLQIGYELDKLYEETKGIIVDLSDRRHVGNNGYIILCDDNGTILNNNHGYLGKDIKEVGLNLDELKAKETDSVEKAIICDAESYYKYYNIEGYNVIAVLGVDEVDLSRNLNIYISSFVQIMIFATLFVLVYILIKSLIVDNIHKINTQLDKITKGDLDVVVDVKSNEEFASLSDDINSTVDALKRYIDEAEKRYEAELETARQIQASMLPNNFDEFCENRNFKLHASMTPAKEVGGDFYDFFMIDDEHLALVIADVSGKGIPASLFMVRAITNIRNVARTGLEPNEILAHVNNQLCKNNEVQMFVTVWLGIYEISTGKLTYANGGHEYPAVRRANGEYELIVERHNMVLGGMEDLKFKKYEMNLSSGDRLFVYTDGVPEATDANNELFGNDRMIEALKACKNDTEPKEVLQMVRGAVDRFVDTAPQFDDLTMLEIKIK